jgi:Autophagy-related protein 27
MVVQVQVEWRRVVCHATCNAPPTHTHKSTTAIMIIRPLIPHSSLPIALLLLSSLVSAQFNCYVNVNSLDFNLTKLAGEHAATRTRTTPPSTMADTLRFDLCADLKPQEGVAEADQVCLAVLLYSSC